MPRGCPSDEVLAQLVDGILPPRESEPAQLHLDACAECRRFVAAVIWVRVESGVKASSSAPTLERSGPTLPLGLAEPGGGLERGAAVGRYLILDRLGEGAMGVVYAAYDPELDRRVALKCLHPRAADGSPLQHERLAREAKALGRLNHPNVVSVYDVVRVLDETFIAMELVQGGTLAEWSQGSPHPLEATLALYRMAGRGLAAAHRAGLVHRDFKPHNVLVTAEGVARVADFGLVSALPEERPVPAVTFLERALPDALVTGSTDPGSLVGTPAFMAPEQLFGLGATPRSDQFSFCVSLWGAVFGKAPFAGTSLRELREAVQVAPVPPALPPVPRSVRAALLRGLSAKPADRFGSMEALLEALKPSQRTAWARFGIVAMVPLVLGLSLWGGQRQRLAQCAAPDAALAQAWSPGVRAEVEGKFLATGVPFARQSFERVCATFDNFVRGWTDLNSSACAAFKVHRSESSVLYGARTKCLERKRDGLAALTRVFAAADRDIVENAVRASSMLDSPGDCASAEQVLANVDFRAAPDSPQRRKLRASLDDAWAFARAFQPARALPLLLSVKEGIRAADEPSFLAEALLLEGTVRGRLSQPESTGPLKESIWLSQSHHLDAWGFKSALELAGSLSYNHAPESALWTDYAEAAAAHLPRHGSAELALELQRTRLARSAENAVEARRHLALASERLTALHRDGTAQELELLDLKASTEDHFGRGGDGAETRKRVLELAEKLYGADHPETARALMELAPSLRRDPARQIEYLERALPIFESTYGGQSLLVAVALDRLGQALHAGGRNEEAVTASEKSVAVFSATHAREAGFAFSLGNLGDLYLSLGRLAEAQRAFERDAETLAQVFGDGDYRRSKPLERLARIALEQKQPLEALRLGQRALDVWKSGPRSARPGFLPQLYLDLAEAAWRAPAQKRSAVGYARSALSEAEKLKDSTGREAAAAWLAGHGS